MRKLNLFAGLAILSVVGLFTSCSSDTTPKPPTITFKGGSSYVSTDVTVDVGSIFTIGITALPNTDSEEKLASFKVVRTFNNIPTTVVDTVFSDKLTSFNADITFGASNTAGTERITFTIVDKNGESAEIALNITTQEVVNGTLKAEKTIVLGGQENATGSFFASLTGDIWTIDQLKSGSHFSQVDLIYYVGATNKEAIFSPKAIVDNNITWTSAITIGSWGTPNATKFKLAGTSDYDNATYNSVQTLGAAADLDLANGGDNPIVGLKAGDIYSFKTAGGKCGVFKVSAVTAGSANTITLAVKVQE
jgi:hypothetical protein